MEGFDWIKLQEEEFGHGLMMSVSNVDILGGPVRASGNGSRPVFVPWGEASIDNPGDGLILDTGMASGGGTSVGEGLDSFECLLSVSNSCQADAASLEDDGISMIFSDCRSLWNFNPVPPLVAPSSSLSGSGIDQVIAKLSPPGKDQDPGNNQHKRKRSDSQQGFISENQAYLKKSKADRLAHPVSSNISFQQASSSASSGDEPDAEAIAQMKEMIYRAAAFRPVHFGAETVDKPKRKNVRISSDPQTVAARQRRERISERIRVLQKLVPGGSKMDTASMLDEAANYLKFLRSHVKALEALSPKIDQTVTAFPANTSLPFSPFVNYTFALQQPQFSIQNQNPVNKSLS